MDRHIGVLNLSLIFNNEYLTRFVRLFIERICVRTLVRRHVTLRRESDQLDPRERRASEIERTPHRRGTMRFELRLGYCADIAERHRTTFAKPHHRAVGCKTDAFGEAQAPRLLSDELA